jgi:heme A synthase
LPNCASPAREVTLSKSAPHRDFFCYAWIVLAYNLPVILWGAFVRISFSGDGCGSHWPTCNGQFVPQKMAVPMTIEFTHRLMTGIDTVAMIILVIWAFVAFPKNHAVRRYSVLSLIFLVIEALLGAGLVLFRLVAHDQSAGRIWYLSAHLTNTLLLLAGLTATAWLAHCQTADLRLLDAPRRLFVALGVAVLVSITGAITALGDTLFPAASLAAGVQQDFASTSTTLLRLRIVHPLIAVSGAAYILWVASSYLRSARSKAVFVIAIVGAQLMAGMLNLGLLAPLPLQLIHLLIADLVWIALVLLTLENAGDPDTAPHARIRAASYAG